MLTAYGINKIHVVFFWKKKTDPFPIHNNCENLRIRYPSLFIIYCYFVWPAVQFEKVTSVQRFKVDLSLYNGKSLLCAVDTKIDVSSTKTLNPRRNIEEKLFDATWKENVSPKRRLFHFASSRSQTEITNFMPMTSICQRKRN